MALIGRIDLEHVPELQRLLSAERKEDHIELDLREVTRVDRDAMKFLSRCEADGIGLKSCPSYLREWIDQDKRKY